MDESLDPTSAEPSVAHSQRHELLIVILQIVAALLANIPLLWPWTATHRVYAFLVAFGVTTWIAKPRLQSWIKRLLDRRRDRRFIAKNDVRLRGLFEQFTAFTSISHTRSLICILRSAYSQNMTYVEQVITGDYISSWVYCYWEELTFPTKSLDHFLSRCRGFGVLVQEYNKNYPLRAQGKLGKETLFAEQFTDQLEEFREEYTAFLRDLEAWRKEIENFLRACGVTDRATLLRLAPATLFERTKSFKRTEPASKA